MAVHVFISWVHIVTSDFRIFTCTLKPDDFEDCTRANAQFTSFLHHIFLQEALKYYLYLSACTRGTENSLFVLLNIAQII